MLQTNHDGSKILRDEKSIIDQISIHSDYQYTNMGKKIHAEQTITVQNFIILLL